MAAVLALAIVLTGTFAWQSLSQRAINNASGVPDPAGARLHDDFADDQNWVTGANKDVYVENYSGSNPSDPLDYGQSVYVRVKLSEYMEIGEGAGKFGYTGATDPIDYQTLDQATTGGTRTPDPDNHAVSLVPGANILNPSTWTPHIPYGQASVSNGPFNTYFAWDMGGSKAFMPTFNKDNTSLLTDRTEYAQDKFVSGTDTETDDEIYDHADLSLNQNTTHTAKETLNTANVITMAQWKSIGSPVENAAGDAYWVGDTDGWFYWSNSLSPGEATGLLLNGMTMDREPSDAWYYAIHVTAQMVTAGDWGDKATNTVFYQDGMTDDAFWLLNQAAKRLPVVTSIDFLEGSKIYAKAGSPVTVHPAVNVKNYSGDPSERAVTWSISPATANFADGTLTPQVGEEGTVYTITATSAALPTSMSTSITVTVVPAVDSTGAVEGVTIPGSQLGDTADWMAIAGKDVGGQPYYLIVRKTVVGSTPFGANGTYVGSYAQTGITNFYGTISATADTYVVNSDADTVLGHWGNITEPISTPMQGSTKAFALSAQEAGKYLSITWRTGSSSAVIQSPSSDIAVRNFGKLSDATSYTFWLRTPSAFNNARYATDINALGNMNDNIAGYNYTIRPAMWVNPDIFVTAAPITP
jgi:hypothetical protein